MATMTWNGKVYRDPDDVNQAPFEVALALGAEYASQALDGEIERRRSSQYGDSTSDTCTR